MPKKGQSNATELCPLCLRQRILKNSHLLARGIYERIKKGGPNLVLITKEKSVPSSLEIRKYLLCDDCENLQLNKKGETPFLRMSAQSDGTFPLRTKIKKFGTRTNQYPTGAFFRIPKECRMEIEAFAHFTLGVIWKGAVTDWRMLGKLLPRLPLSLKDRERFRKYLLGEATFPEEAAFLPWLAAEEECHLVAHPPLFDRLEGTNHYELMVLGCRLHLFLGKNLRPDIRAQCAMTAAQPVIYITTAVAEKLRRSGGELVKDSQLSSKLRVGFTKHLESL